MKLFKYDETKLEYVSTTIIKNINKFLIFLIFILIIILSINLNKKIDKVYEIETEILVLNKEDEFSEKEFDIYLNSLNLKFSHIVKAQAIIESSHFQSDIFKINNNMFGMKVAKLRPTTSKGENLNHAYYDTWKDCVLDYALYQAAYLRQIKTEDDYYEYLKVNYAEDTSYVNLIKQIVNQEK